MRNVLISISDRTGILEFAEKLCGLGFNIIATSGTREFLTSKGVVCKNISGVTGFPEILSGRVKTLHPKILGAILADRDNPAHLAELKELGIPQIEIVVCNLYPFDSVQGIENIDIGGVTLMRAAAKNYKHVACITNSSQYPKVIAELTKHGRVSEQTKLEFAKESFKLTSSFDTRVANFLGVETLNLSYEKIEDLRYGENPHQKATLYREIGYKGLSVIDAVKLQGKGLSFNNLYDADAAFTVIKSFDEPCCCIVKHGTPSGIAIGKDIFQAYKDAFRADPMSPFGGIVGFNRELDGPTAEEIIKILTHVVIAPDYADEAKEIFKRKKNLILLQLQEGKLDSKSIRWINGGIMVQDSDIEADELSNWKVVTEREPTSTELEAMKFGFKVVKFIKSNAVCIVSDKMTLGVGGGQPDRSGSLRIAIYNMERFGLTKEIPKAVASDGLFPFRDSVDLAASEGIKAIIQPGSSIKDKEVIDACNEHNIAMIFTHRRHFRH